MLCHVRFQSVWLVILGLIVISGCGKTDKIQYAPVRGLVIVDGKPLANATVIYIPQRNGESTQVGQPSFGRTDEQGRYQLMTASQTSGAVVGRHRVSISTEVSDPSTGEVSVPETLPERFHKKTILEIEVPKGGLSEANFELSSANK